MTDERYGSFSIQSLFLNGGVSGAATEIDCF
jgi:hypothetical protein